MLTTYHASLRTKEGTRGLCNALHPSSRAGSSAAAASPCCRRLALLLQRQGTRDAQAPEELRPCFGAAGGARQRCQLRQTGEFAYLHMWHRSSNATEREYSWERGSEGGKTLGNREGQRGAYRYLKQ